MTNRWLDVLFLEGRERVAEARSPCSLCSGAGNQQSSFFTKWDLVPPIRFMRLRTARWGKSKRKPSLKAWIRNSSPALDTA